MWEGSLPRFYFDTCDGERQVRDELGIDLASRDDIPRETATLLMGLGQSEMLNGRSKTFTVKVRNGDGALLYRGIATLDIQPPPRRRRFT